MTTDDRDSRAAWTKPITREEWRSFLDFNFNNPSRPLVYRHVPEMLKGSAGASFLEIGFGQCQDFKNCFKALHDAGMINYRGIDITEQFARYAAEEYPGYDFGVGGFDDIDKDCDVIYTSQTLEHLHPDKYREALKNMLYHARRYCVIVWFQTPGPEERIHWSDVDGFGNEGAWVNRYSAKVIDDMIWSAGMWRFINHANEDRSIYVCGREALV